MTDEIKLPDGWELHSDMVQDDLEKFETEKDQADKDIPIDVGSSSTVGRNNRRWIVAAINANWFKACPYKPAELGQQSPAELAAVALSVASLYWQSASPTEKKF